MNPVVSEAIDVPDDVVVPWDRRGFELIDGRLKEKPMGMEASAVGACLLRLLGAHIASNSLGHVFNSECGYQIFADHPTRIRKPDGSFVARGKLPDEKPFRGHSKVPPDLAFEVVSPNDFAEEVNEKVVEFLGAGVRRCGCCTLPLEPCRCFARSAARPSWLRTTNSAARTWFPASPAASATCLPTCDRPRSRHEPAIRDRRYFNNL